MLWHWGTRGINRGGLRYSAALTSSGPLTWKQRRIGVRSDVKESQDRSLEALQSANAPDARSVVSELDEADALDKGLTPGGEIVAEELIVQVIPQAADEFTCYSCFLVRHRSQLARESNGHSYCIECEG